MTDKQSLITTMADRYMMEPAKFAATIKATCMPDKATDEQFAAFLMVAKEHNLNPLTREVYAFPAKGGGIQPIVSIDGWLKIINAHQQTDGLTTEDVVDPESGEVTAVTAKIYRKDRNHPTVVTERLSECKGNTEPWKKWPARMLRHKAVIQCARYSFGFTQIIDQDEYDRQQQAEFIDVTPTPVADLNAKIREARGND